MVSRSSRIFIKLESSHETLSERCVCWPEFCTKNNLQTKTHLRKIPEHDGRAVHLITSENISSAVPVLLLYGDCHSSTRLHRCNLESFEQFPILNYEGRLRSLSIAQMYCMYWKLLFTKHVTVHHFNTFERRASLVDPNLWLPGRNVRIKAHYFPVNSHAETFTHLQKKWQFRPPFWGELHPYQTTLL